MQRGGSAALMSSSRREKKRASFSASYNTCSPCVTLNQIPPALPCFQFQTPRGTTELGREKQQLKEFLSAHLPFVLKNPSGVRRGAKKWRVRKNFFHGAGEGGCLLRTDDRRHSLFIRVPPLPQLLAVVTEEEESPRVPKLDWTGEEEVPSSIPVGA